jgi:hypothetical protein
MDNFVISNNSETKIIVTPKTIDGEIGYWECLTKDAHRYYTKVREVAIEVKHNSFSRIR